MTDLPRCSGCRNAASHEVVQPDGSPFPEPIYVCDSGAKDVATRQRRRLNPVDFGRPRIRSTATSAQAPGVAVAAEVERVPARGLRRSRTRLAAG